MAAKPKTDTASIKLPESRIEEACAPSWETRYYLHDCYLDTGGNEPLIVATDGHILAARVLDGSGDMTPGPIPKAALEYAKPAEADEIDEDDEGCGGYPELNLTAEQVSAGPAHFDRNAVKYPDWRRVVPEVSGEPDIMIDARLLDRLQKALCAVGALQGVALWLKRGDKGQIDPGGCIYVRPFSERNEAAPVAFGCIMPLKT